METKPKAAIAPNNAVETFFRKWVEADEAGREAIEAFVSDEFVGRDWKEFKAKAGAWREQKGIKRAGAASPGIKASGSGLPSPDPAREAGDGPPSASADGSAEGRFAHVASSPAQSSAEAMREALTGWKEPKAKPEDEAEVEGQPEGKPGDFFNVDLTGEDHDVLEPNLPYENAKRFAKRFCLHEQGQSMWFQDKVFWRWNGRTYEPENDIRGMLWRFQAESKRRHGKGKVPFEANTHRTNEIYDALSSALRLDAIPPRWLPEEAPASDWTVFANGLVNTKTGKRMDFTPKFWAQGGLKFDWNPAAEAPRWQRFLMEIFPRDPAEPIGPGNFDEESGQFIEEFLGCCMTDDVHLQKAAMFIGRERCGKGTIITVAKNLVGASAHAGLDINSWLRGEKSLQVLLGKRVVSFGDVVLKPGRSYGQNFDPGGLPHDSAGWLLQLASGGDVVIPRMFQQAETLVLPLKIIMASNQMINFNHKILPSRFIYINFPISYLGREDPELYRKLEAELPGIAARCTRAYRETLARGAFIQPASGLALRQTVEARSDAFTEMALECFEPDPEGFVSKQLAWSKFELWCAENKRGDLRSQVNNPSALYRRLQEIPGFGAVYEARPSGKPRGWLGMSIKFQGA